MRANGVTCRGAKSRKENLRPGLQTHFSRHAEAENRFSRHCNLCTKSVVERRSIEQVGASCAASSVRGAILRSFSSARVFQIGEALLVEAVCLQRNTLKITSFAT